MTLVEIAENIADDLGRPELVIDFAGEDFTPTEAFRRSINRAHKYLDRLHRLSEPKAHRDIALAQGAYQLPVPEGFRHVYGIDLLDSDGLISAPLKQRKMAWLRENFGETFSAVDQGSPLYWARNTNGGTTTTTKTIEFNIDGDPDFVLTPPSGKQYSRDKAVFSEDGTRFALFSNNDIIDPNKYIYVYSTDTGALVSTVSVVTGGNIERISLNSDGTMAACTLNAEKEVRGYSVTAAVGVLSWTKSLAPHILGDIAYSPDNAYLAVGSDYTDTLLLNGASGAQLSSFACFGYLAWSSDSAQLLIMQTSGIKVVSVPSMAEIASITPTAFFQMYGTRCISPDGSKVISASTDGATLTSDVLLFNVATGGLLARLAHPFSGARAAFLSDDYILTVGYWGKGYVWSTADYSLQYEFNIAAASSEVTVPFTNHKNFALVDASLCSVYSFAFTVSETSVPESDVLITMPPADAAYTARLFCCLYCPEMVENGDVTCWSSEEADILALAIKRQVAIDFNRNATEVREYTELIAEAIDAIEVDAAFEDQNSVDPLELRFGSTP